MYKKLGKITFPRVCDTCGSASCAVFCPIHSTFMCLSCDIIVHMKSQHKRMNVCDACVRQPAEFYCSADVAFLCSSCDQEIHSVNPLASRHERVSVLTIGEENHCVHDDDVAEAASWLVLNPEKNDDCEGLVLKVDDDDGLCDVDYYDVQMQHQQVPRFELGLEFDSSKSAYDYGSLSQSVSISSTDVNSVPKSTISEVSVSDSINPPMGTTLDLINSGPNILMPSSYLTYREARVLRYKEKKKARKFEKKIRYASRKAYAEIRPRIKGRFAKRNNVEAEMDHVLSSTLITKAEYGVVPSF
ncbi:hypothetical protein VNO78_33692 [Psophocarpus tetragonolobus]|uniref:CONSTANS-like protein n=1 Tax=Psophocarpus tetragonolobus TaxID=3891 RepID=A0AAN9NXG1_PSOTE